MIRNAARAALKGVRWVTVRRGGKKVRIPVRPKGQSRKDIIDKAVYHVSPVKDIKNLKPHSWVSTRRKASDSMVISVNRMNKMKSYDDVERFFRGRGAKKDTMSTIARFKKKGEDPRKAYMFASLDAGDAGAKFSRYEQLWADFGKKFIGKKPYQYRGKYAKHRVNKPHPRDKHGMITGSDTESWMWTKRNKSPEAGINLGEYPALVTGIRKVKIRRKK